MKRAWLLSMCTLSKRSTKLIMNTIESSAKPYASNGFLSVPRNSLRGIANRTNTIVVMPNAAQCGDESK